MNGPRRRIKPDAAAAAAEIRAHQMQLDQPAPRADADLGDKLAAIADRLETAQTRAIEAIAPAVGGMRSDLAALADRLAQPAAAPDLSPLREQFDSLRRALATSADRSSIETLRGEIASLARRMEQAHPAVDIAPIQEQIASLAKRLASVGAASEIAPLRQQIAALAKQFEAAQSTSRAQDDLAALQNAVISAVRERETLDTSRLLGGLETRIGAASDRISGDVRRQMQDAIVELRQALKERAHEQSEPIADAVRGLSDRFDAAYARRDDGTMLVRIESQLASLATRFDRLHEEPAATMDNSQLRLLAGEIHRMAQELGPTPAVAKLESQIQALDAKLDDVRNRPLAVSGKKAAADLSGIETLIRALTDKMEAAREEQTGAEQLGELQRQIRAVAEKLDDSSGAQSLSAIERSVSDLFAQIDSLRHDRDAAAESVARRAAEAAAREVADDVARRAADPRIETLADDMSALRRTSDLVDRKTHETLEAIHTALERIVDRISVMENEPARTADARPSPPPAEAASPAEAAPAPAAAPIAAPQRAPEPAPVRADEGLSTVRLTGRRQAASAAAEPAEAAKPRFSLKLPFLSRSKTTPDAEGRTPAVKPDAPDSAALDADAPLEPGSGRPAKTAPDSASALRNQLVAAARRASQIATEESAAGRAPKPAAEAAATGEGGKAKSLLEAQKKPILIGLAALVLAVVAFGALNRPHTAPASPVEEKVTAIVPSPSASEAPDAAPVAPTMANAPTETAPEGQKNETAAIVPPSPDPAVVGSIPPAQELAPATGARTPIDLADLPAAIAGQTLRSAALSGDPAAAYEVGSRLFDGRGVSRDPRLALKWFERAANEGLAPAQFRVGNMYEKGVGATRDLKLARQWYQRAADKGNAKALHNLGVLIAEGGDGKPDYAAAAGYFTKAAQLGVRDSQYNIAILLARGLGVGQSMTDAYMWLSVAAQQGDDEAARKRDEIGQRLSPAELATAKSAAQQFKPAPSDRFANDVAAPEKGWDAPTNAAAPARKPKADGGRS